MLGFYLLLRKIFLRIVSHEPQDTYLNWSPGHADDRLFNILYFGSSVFIELVTIGTFMELAKKGW